MTDVAAMLRACLGLAEPIPLTFGRGAAQDGDGFNREHIEYDGLEGDVIPAFLFTPQRIPAHGGVVLFHQHKGEFHFGKSDVAGNVGRYTHAQVP